MDVLLRYAWGILMLASLISALGLRQRVQPYINANHSLKKGYYNFIWARLLFMTIPIAIIAVACMSGKTENILDFIRLRELNPFVLAFHFTLIAEGIATYYWIFYDSGMKYLKKHPGTVLIKTKGVLRDRIYDTDVKKIYKRVYFSYAVVCCLLCIFPVPNIHF